MLKQRVLTAALGLLAVLIVVAAGTLPWHVAVWVATLLGAVEFNALLGFRWLSLASVWSFVVITVIEWWPHWNHPFVLEMMVACALVWPVWKKNKLTVTQSAAVLLGAWYLGLGGQALDGLRGLPHGLAWVLFVLVCIWLTDTFAYFAGTRIGGPKLWPAISPAKTLSGSFAGVLAAALGAMAYGFWVFHGKHLWAYMVTGILVSVLGQIGDLVESAYKRSAGAKDSGRLLPGHGGLLDRVDSLLFAAPFAWFWIAFYASAWLH